MKNSHEYGEWIFVNQSTNYLEPPSGDTCKCSVCGFEIDVSETYLNACPNCNIEIKEIYKTGVPVKY